jgi:hypothetical protein
LRSGRSAAVAMAREISAGSFAGRPSLHHPSANADVMILD